MGVSIRRFPGTPGTLTELTTLFNRDASLRAAIDTACRAAQPKRRPTRGVFALIALALALLLSSPAFADTVFSEDFSGGAGQFTGFATGCNWHTPGLNAAMISYFGNDQYAEVRKGGCGSPIFSAAIVSSSFSLAGHENAELSFRHVLDQSGTIGQGTVSVSTNGGSTWTTVFSTGGNDAGSTKTVDLSNYDGQANVKIRFSYSYFGGILAAAWGVDDVTVEADAIADDDTADDDTADDDTADDDTADDDTADDDTADDDTADDDTADDDTADDDTGDDDDDDNDIAYVYSFTIARAQDYESFLVAQGYSVTLIQIAELDLAPDLSDIDVFVIDSDTAPDWNTTRRGAIVDTGAPVIGDGDGLEALADTDLYLGAGHFIAVNNQDSMYAHSLGHRIWNTPNDLELEADDVPVPIVQSPITIRALENDGDPLGVQFLGESPDYPGDFPLAVEHTHYAVWSFGIFGPSLYTDAGKALFVNLIEYVKSTPKRIGLVYADDGTAAAAYEALLESVGYQVDTIALADLAERAGGDGPDVYIVDDSADGAAWTAETAAILTNSGKPIIANNRGVHVFDYTSQYLHAANTLNLDASASFVPRALDHDVWTQPYDLGLDGSAVDALAAPVGHLGLHQQAAAPVTVAFLGQDTAYLNHYPIAIEDNRYALWGFGATTPDNWTPTAQELYFNLIEYLAAGEPGGDDDTDDDADDDTDDDADDDADDDDAADDDAPAGDDDDDTDDDADDDADDDDAADDDAPAGDDDDDSSGGCGC